MAKASRERASASRTAETALVVPTPKVSDQLCFALYLASRGMTRLYRLALDGVGLTYPQYLVMLVLFETGPETVSGIGRRLDLDSGTLTPLLKRLEIAGYLSRTRRETDEREVIVALTEAGQAVRAAASEARASVVRHLGWPESDLGRLHADLKRLVAAVGSDEAASGLAVPCDRG